jgi:bifunctional DNase/RNase
MTIKGLMVDPKTNMPIIILRDKDGLCDLPVWCGVFEANAIALHIEHIRVPRPLTHDLMMDIIQHVRGRIDKIVVSDLKEDTFYALIYLTVAGMKTMAIDARPSDAIALAVRAGAPIFVEDSVIVKAKSSDKVFNPPEDTT